MSSNGTISQPNATLYVSNIDWGVKKPLLRRALYSLFSRHGKVVEIVALRTEGLRGQAWVLFEDVQAATAALQAEQGFTFFGKDLKIQYAREKSDRHAKRDGTYVPKAKRNKNKNASGSATTTNEGAADSADGDREASAIVTDAASNSSTSVPHDASANSAPPSSILIATNLPTECNEMMLAMLFQQYAGYKEVRMPRSGLAFIEFDDEPHATLAMRGLDGFQLTKQDKLLLNYGKS